jgi:Zn-dependent peptidase ImmA (M78 family)
MQRSFAAELLSPFDAVDDMLQGDYSAEAQQGAAEHFDVSERTILTLLVNHRRLEREELDEELAAA